MQAILKDMRKIITFFNADRKVKYCLSLAMQNFQNTVENSPIFDLKSG